jgi:hypothetical protein
LRQLLGVGIPDRDDLELVQGDLDVSQLQDVEEPPDVRGRIGEDKQVRLPVDVTAPRCATKGREIDRIRRADVSKRHDLGQTLVARAQGSTSRPTTVLPTPAAAPRGDDPVTLPERTAVRPLTSRMVSSTLKTSPLAILPDGLDCHLPSPRGAARKLSLVIRRA